MPHIKVESLSPSCIYFAFPFALRFLSCLLEHKFWSLKSSFLFIHKNRYDFLTWIWLSFLISRSLALIGVFFPKLWGANLFDYLFWWRGGSNDNTTRKWVIRNILKENCTYINDIWEKPLHSLTQSWILPLLVTARRVCAEESLVGICHMRAHPSVGEAPQHYSKYRSRF